MLLEVLRKKATEPGHRIKFPQGCHDRRTQTLSPDSAFQALMTTKIPVSTFVPVATQPDSRHAGSPKSEMSPPPVATRSAGGTPIYKQHEI